jgi:hypothetical protein
MYFENYDLRDAPELIPLRVAKKFPCYSTCVNWIRIFHATGDICPKRAMGNHHAEREVQGTDLEQLGLYRAIFPRATIAECRAYLFNLDPTKELYSGSQVRRAESLLGLKRKATSTTADLAFLPGNLQTRELYWTYPPPLGMRGVPISNIIDIDEVGFFLEHSDRRFGKTVSCLRCCLVSTEKGRRSIYFLQYVVMMLAECVGTNNGWMEAQPLRDFMILLIIFWMI